MSSRSPARWLAPLALLAAVVAVALTVNGALGDDSDEAARPATPASTSADGDGARGGDRDARGTQTGSRSSGGSGPRTYTIKAGDTLATIAEETGVSVEELEELNPDLDPQALTVGQRLRLRR